MHYNIDFHSYADDMQLYKALPNISETSTVNTQLLTLSVCVICIICCICVVRKKRLAGPAGMWHGG